MTGLAGVCALLVGVSLSSCAAPSYTYIADSGNSTYFKVPYGWHQISPTALCTELRSGTPGGCPTVWLSGYEAASGKASAHDFVSSTLSRPFVLAEVGPYTSQTGAPLTDDTLRDFFLPVTQAARAAWQAQTGAALRGFRSLRDSTLPLHSGVHGVRETFDYGSGPTANTFDEVIFANSAGTTVYALLLHCTTSCYSQERNAIDAVMTSFTVRN
jgi:hypothetical protein